MTLNFKHFIDSFLHMPCCVIGCSSVDNLYEREKTYFNNFMPTARTAIVFGHHITKKTEWTWCATDDGSQRCDADDHTADLCSLLKEKINRRISIVRSV
jgi:hypothetical protein